MDVPELVTEELDDESVLASVGIGGEDGVYATPSRTLVYRGDGLLSDESVETYPHDFERLELSEGRRRSKFTLVYVDRSAEFRVGSDHTHDVLRMVLAAHLRATGAIDADEQVRGVFRFSDLTLVVGTAHLLKYVGSAVWSTEYESFPYADLTDLAFEEGSHALQVVVAVDGRPERIKVPSDRAGEVRRTVEREVFEFHDVDSLSALRAAVAPPEEDQEAAETDPEPETEGDTGAGVEEEFSGGGFRSLLDEEDDEDGEDAAAATGDDSAPEGTDEPPAADPELVERLDDLERAIERQTELIERQQETIEQLVEELRRGR